MRYLALLLALILSGCATGVGVTGMTPEQLAEFARIKVSTVTCVRGVYAGVTVTATFLNVDSVKAMPSGILVEENCKITFTHTKTP